ncbi:VolA/Pla-1 family phospholipase [Photobacterium sp. TY1-4]|uniref:VolA/Pla-1 family phospholipase n=1 Tax=Photobacterium sp. TY1-4 TaxID=2899122 RepID=UPI0021BFD38C|nr:VolA/Pla-1 family phospholipase [Photobacterium sp. TY1-4]UXI00379.1 lipase [Photobacterium sp. TY1-4]
MNKKLLALLIGANLALYGCDDTKISGEPTVDPAIERSLQAETKIAFDLLAEEPTLILPTFIAMDSTDGTLGLESSSETGSLMDPKVAMGKTDGWSTTQPISISFTGAELDPNTAASAFFLIKSDSPTTTKSVSAKQVLSQADGDFVVSVQGDTLNVILIKPLDPKSDYMFALTDDLKDKNGNSVGMSQSYAYLKADTPTPSQKLDKAQAYTHQIEAAFAAQGIDKDKIIYSSWFTTASVGDVLFATKGAIASALSAIKQGGTANAVWQGSANPNDVDTTGLFTLNTPAEVTAILPEPYKSALGSKGMKTYKGILKLPYFLESSVTDEKWKKTPWQSGMPSLAKISNVLNNGTDADKAAVMAKLTEWGITSEDLAKVSSDQATQLKVMTALIGKTLYLADGTQLDPAREITRYSPIPQLKSVEEINYLLVMPDLANCAGVTTGVPVNIYQHGITAYKETLLALAPEAINNNCQAIIAIDHPLHGERRLSDGTITDEDNPDVFMNLSYLTVGRDNFRQSVSDAMGLRASLGMIFARNQAGDPSVGTPLNMLSPVNGASVGVGYVGHSLGALTGIGYAATISKPIADEATEQALFKVNRAQFANPGAGIPYLLMNSERFGGVVKDKLLTAASEKYVAYKAKACPGLDGPTCFSNFYAMLGESDKAKVNSDLSSFAYAAQTVLDTVDPMNHIGTVLTTTPSYLTMVLGDTVIPNGLDAKQHSPYSPFGGTLPLIYSGYNQVTTTVANAEREAVIFTSGDHGSLLDPATDAGVTGHMQGQTYHFINAGSVTITAGAPITTVPKP